MTRLIFVSLVLGTIACGPSVPAESRTIPPPSGPTPPLVPSFSIASLSPATAIVGSDAITITAPAPAFIQGGSVPGSWSFALWSANGMETDLPTRVVSDTQLTASVPAKLLKDPGLAQVMVVNGD